MIKSPSNIEEGLRPATSSIRTKIARNRPVETKIKIECTSSIKPSVFNVPNSDACVGQRLGQLSQRRQIEFGQPTASVNESNHRVWARARRKVEVRELLRIILKNLVIGDKAIGVVELQQPSPNYDREWGIERSLLSGFGGQITVVDIQILLGQVPACKIFISSFF